jgi:hypothetical protein
MLFLLDGTPIRFHKGVTDFLSLYFTKIWIGGGGPVTWSPRSSDITPLEFLFWGYIRDAVDVPSLATTLAELSGRK